MATQHKVSVLKHRRSDSEGETPHASETSPSKSLVVVPRTMRDARSNELLPRDIVPRTASVRLPIIIDPDFISKLVQSGILGYSRDVASLIPTIHYYEIRVTAFRTAIQDLLTKYIKIKLYESESMTFAQADAQVTRMAPILTDGCMAALYSKLHCIHQHFQNHTDRFPTSPSCTKDIELPLPFADAIQNFGVFTPHNMPGHYICVPVYPENVKNEGRSQQIWSRYEYESCLPYLKTSRIPVKSVDTQLKKGTPWWTYKSSFKSDYFDLRCIFSPSNYSEHSALSASMFISVDEDEQPVQIITHLADDVDYPVRFREIPKGFQLQAFDALCYAPHEEWD